MLRAIFIDYSRKFGLIPVGEILSNGTVLTASLNGTWQALPVFFKKDTPQKWVPFQVPQKWNLNVWNECDEAWFVRPFLIPDAFSNKNLFAEFDCVLIKAEVFINGQFAVEHTGFNSAFDVDITKYTHAGKTNYLQVLIKGNKRFINDNNGYLRMLYDLKEKTGKVGGIPLPVRLAARGKINVKETIITPSVREKKISGEIVLRSSGEKPAGSRCELDIIPRNSGEKTIFSIGEYKLLFTNGSSGDYKISFDKKWDNPHLWDINDPFLYFLRIKIYDEKNTLTEEYLERFGFREFWINDRDFILNNKKIHLLGPSEWMSLSMGAYMLRGDYHREMLLAMKNLNINAVRCHGQYFPQSLYEAADEIGILCIMQFVSIYGSTRENYKRGGDLALTNIREDFTLAIKTLYNHPSIVIWDV
ncbi:MAG TPA: hypothetical protein DC049_18415, partial [Spirochaetia bacterium]|nr:hypothetical protein [Spirochaetia bacterium]